MLFVNLYGGNCAQKMELNRKGVEKALGIAHLDGQVFLSSLSPSRQRSIEANPDGSILVKRSLMLGEKIEEDEKDNPLYRVVSVPQGWRIEINDQKLTEELTERKLTGKKLQRAFIKEFDGQFRQALRECVWREKISGEKDALFKTKMLLSLAYPLLDSYFIVRPIIENATLETIAVGTYVAAIFLFMFYGFVNSVVRVDNYKTIRFRKCDSFWEYFMPPVEIDKVARTFAYLLPVIGKGRTLVRKIRE